LLWFEFWFCKQILVKLTIIVIICQIFEPFRCLCGNWRRRWPSVSRWLPSDCARMNPCSTLTTSSKRGMYVLSVWTLSVCMCVWENVCTCVGEFVYVCMCVGPPLGSQILSSQSLSAVRLCREEFWMSSVITFLHYRRYPTFVDAVRDLDDALCMVFLFAQMSSNTQNVNVCLYVCLYVCMDVCMYVCTMYVCTMYMDECM
jgi:hypothetical protein